MQVTARYPDGVAIMAYQTETAKLHTIGTWIMCPVCAGTPYGLIAYA